MVGGTEAETDQLWPTKDLAFHCASELTNGSTPHPWAQRDLAPLNLLGVPLWFDRGPTVHITPSVSMYPHLLLLVEGAGLYTRLVSTSILRDRVRRMLCR